MNLKMILIIKKDKKKKETSMASRASPFLFCESQIVTPRVRHLLNVGKFGRINERKKKEAR